MKNTIKFLGIGGMDAAVTKQTLHGFGGVLPQAKLLAKKSAWTLIFLAAVIGFSTVSCETFSGLLGGIGGGQTTYAIGDRGPGGGIVFYDKGNGNDGWRYLEAAPADIEGQFAWATPAWVVAVRDPYGRDGEGGYSYMKAERDIGKGKVNTATILSVDPNAPAAKACVDYRGGGLDDWFLPSNMELQEMHKQKSLLKLRGSYWSSSQWYAAGADVLFDNGQVNQKNHNTENRIRPVRAFLTSKQGAPAVQPFALINPLDKYKIDPAFFEPANQPPPVGTWVGGATTYTFNANGTGTVTQPVGNNPRRTDNITWSASGNRLTVIDGGQPQVYTYKIVGNTLTWYRDRPENDSRFLREWIRQ